MSRISHRIVQKAVSNNDLPDHELGKGRAVAMTKEFLNIGELSELLEIKKSTLYSLVENGELPHYKIGRLIRFKRNDVDAWMEKHRREGNETDKKTKEILKNIKRPNLDTGGIVKRSIEEVKGRRYNCANGKPDRIKGLRKEV